MLEWKWKKNWKELENEELNDACMENGQTGKCLKVGELKDACVYENWKLAKNWG